MGVDRVNDCTLRGDVMDVVCALLGSGLCGSGDPREGFSIQAAVKINALEADIIGGLLR